MKRLLPILLACILPLCSCTENRVGEDFLTDGTPRLCVAGHTAIRYDENSCQLSYNRDRREFRIGTDDLSSYCRVKLENLPTRVGEQLHADVFWTTERDVVQKNDVVLEVLKLENDTVYLWDSRGNISLVLRFLE